MQVSKQGRSNRTSLACTATISGVAPDFVITPLPCTPRLSKRRTLYCGC